MPRVTVYTADETYMGLIDEASYLGTCLKVDIVSKKDDPKVHMLDWHFQVTWEGKDVTLRRTTMLSGRGVGFTREVLAALKVDYDEAPGEKLDFDTDDCINLQCGVVVKHESYNDKMRNKIDSFFPWEEEEDEGNAAAAV
jgi:hypothetical protein